MELDRYAQKSVMIQWQCSPSARVYANSSPAKGTSRYAERLKMTRRQSKRLKRCIMTLSRRTSQWRSWTAWKKRARSRRWCRDVA